MPESTSRETVKDVLEYPIAMCEERGISEATCEYFNVRMRLSDEDGETIEAYYFPYYNQKGKLTGFKKRDMTLNKEEKYHFTVVGKVGVSCKLFGQIEAEKVERKRKKLIFTEGEWDVLAGYEAIKQDNAGGKWKDLNPFIVGLSCGTKNATDATVSNVNFLDSFEEVCFALDNDEANSSELKKKIKKGKEATQDIAAILVGKDLKNLNYKGSDYKDLGEILTEKGSCFLSSMLAFDFEAFVAEKVVTASQIGFETFIQERPEGLYIDTFPLLMGKIHGFRKRELVVITSPSGVGKSTCTSEIAHGLACHDQRVGMIFLEEETNETLQRQGARYLKKNYNHFKKNPQKFESTERLKEAYDWCSDDNRFVFLDHFGSIQIDDLMNKIKMFVYQYKVDYIILDHLSMLVSGLGTNDERAALERVMVELAAFVAANDVGIIAVSHLNRKVVDGYKPTKGKEEEPFWVSVRKEDMKGASGLEQLSWIVLGLEPEVMPDKSRGRVRWTVLKNRPWGYLGVADTFQMDDDTGLLNQAGTGY